MQAFRDTMFVGVLKWEADFATRTPPGPWGLLEYSVGVVVNSFQYFCRADIVHGIDQLVVADHGSAQDLYREVPRRRGLYLNALAATSE